MQTANLILSLGGDPGNTVPMYAVTAAEIPVLQLVHGADAIRDIEPSGDLEETRTAREERMRLRGIYGAPVDELYPGIAAQVFQSLNELDLPEHFFKPETRATARSAPTASAVEAKSARRGRQAAVAEAADEDGVSDMPGAAFN